MTFHSHEFGNPGNLPEVFLMGRQLRDARRSRGLSQTQLAELLGIAQSNISKWESGAEEASPECLRRLTDVLLNKSGRLNRYIESLVARGTDINVFSLHADNTMKFRHLSKRVEKTYRAEKNFYLGRDVSKVLDIDWREDIFDGMDFREMVHCQYDHDMAPATGKVRMPTKRIHVTSFVMQFDIHDTVLITHTQFSPATGEPASEQERVMAHDLLSS